MHKKHHKKILRICIIIAIFGIFLIQEMITTYQVHETFEGYCHRRGLIVVDKKSEYGYCKNPTTNKEYKIVLFKNRWYLDGDLPCGFLCF